MSFKKILTTAILSFALLGNITQAQQKTIQPDRPILLIGLDGFAGNICKEHIDKFPNLKKLQQHGSYTFESRTVLPSSSAANWASIFTGSSPELHGFTQATSQKPEVKPRIIGKYDMYPGIFGLIKDQRKSDKTACFYQWGGLQYVLEMKAISKTQTGKGENLTKEAISHMTKVKPSLMFVVYDEPDHPGHDTGWGSPEYIEKCKELDGYVGELIEAANNAFKGKDPIIFVVSDHGGRGKGHGGKSMNEMNPILFIYGKGIKKGYELKDSIMVYDVGATIASFKNLKVPQSWIGRPIIEALEK